MKKDLSTVYFCSLSVVTFLLSYIKEGHTIECYECNSYYPDNAEYGQYCRDSPQKLKFIPGFYRNCSSESKRCRKINLEIKEKSGNIIERTFRQCATNLAEEEGCFDRAGTYKVQTEHCECSGDGCNSATTIHVSIASVFSFVIASLLSQRT